MKRILSATMALLASTAASAQPIPAPALSQLKTAPAAAAKAISAKPLAPMRDMLTFTPIQVLSAGRQIGGGTVGTLYTWQMVTPMEGAATAIRIAMTQQYNEPTQIASATVYMSDSYSGYVQNGAIQPLNAAQLTTIPTANSVYATCTLNATTTVTCPSTAGFPNSTTMYVIGPQGSVPVNATATVTNGTTVTLSGSALTSGSVRLQFANLATGCKLYWDNAGANVDTINTSTGTRSYTLNGNPANTVTANNYPMLMEWSDLVPCSAVARADGGAQYLAFVYVTTGANTVSWTGFGVTNLNYYATGTGKKGAATGSTTGYNGIVGGPVLNGRYIFAGKPWNNGGVDYADAPAGTGYSQTTIFPVLQIQYLSQAKGWNVLQVGDSISAAPPDDNFSSGVNRACRLLSTPQAPCEWSSVAWGGAASPLYDESLRNNIAALQPSAVIGQPISRNDTGGPTLANFKMLLAKVTAYSAAADARLGLLGAFPFTTTLDGSATAQTAVSTMRTLLASISTTCQPGTGGQVCPKVPVLDPVPVVTRAAIGGNFWNYLGAGMVANGATAAGATSIAITAGSALPCYTGDILSDITTAGVVASGATVVSSTNTAITVASNAVVGSGIVAGDQLECNAPGWSGGALTYDNTHPWYPAITLLQPYFNTFLQQTLGLQ